MTNPTACRELKPCPFCGSNNVYIAEPDDGSFERFVRCENCLAIGPECTNASPSAAWNTRAPEGEAVALTVTDHAMAVACIPSRYWDCVREAISLCKSAHPRATSAEVERDAASVALRFAARIVELYDDATMRSDHMIDSGDCAAILNALADSSEIIDAALAKRGEVG